VKEIAFFDFDGTLTKRDSLKFFLSYVSGNHLVFLLNYYVRCFIFIAKMKLGTIKVQQLKEKRLTLILNSISDEKLEEISNIFAETQIPLILREKGMERISFHQELGHDVVLVSASVNLFLKPWCDKHGIMLITNEIKRNRSTDRMSFREEDCNGEMKVLRIKRLYDLEKYAKIFAYGDTAGDSEMLAISDEQFYKPFED
jgi:phosphatidylglycerophosphatase C